ncbi:MAG TPA: hypothetical protein DCY74_01230, partial [Clostridiales bacterium]|nr:hypothetical protein [Clostridiales bacterium]
CGVITERAIEYKNSIYCEDCYQNALPRICDICGGHADDGEIYNGIVYCGGCFDAYCDENDVHECANCGKFKKDCVNKKEEAGSIDVWICQDCNSDGKFTEDNTIEVQ